MFNPLRALSRWAVKRAAKYAGIPLRDPALVAMLGQQPAHSGIDVTESSALNCSAWWAGVNIISQTVASLPVVAKELGPRGGSDVAKEHRVHYLVHHEPNAEMTPFVFFETLQAHALSWGNGYAEIEWAGGVPVALWPLMPNYVEPDRDDNDRLIYRVRDDEGHTEIYQPHDVLHVPGLGFDGTRGYSVVQMARETIGLALATEQFGAAYFGRGATPGGVLTHPGELTDKAKKNLRESWELLHRGPDNAHRVAVLDEGMAWQNIGIPPDDSQFLQTRQFSVVEIARWFNIPPHLLRDLSQATFSNIEHQGLDFLIYTLRPWLTKWAQEIRRKLFTPEERLRFHVDHMVGELLRTDMPTRFNAYRVAREGGWYTLNDILDAEKMPRVEGPEGNERLCPANMDVLGRERQATPAPEGPLDVDALQSAVNMLKTLKPVSWALAREVFRAVHPGATDVFVNQLCAKLKLEGTVGGPAPEDDNVEA